MIQLHNKNALARCSQYLSDLCFLQMVDDQNITRWNIDILRSQIGTVFHEPFLFNRTYAENIAYGDLSRKLDMEDIINAAKAANIHDYISELPLVQEYFVYSNYRNSYLLIIHWN